MNSPFAAKGGDGTERRVLVAGGLAAILASTCCLGPLVLVALGFSGAWISNLAVFEPYQPIFIGAALVALFFAWQRIWQSAPTCAPGEVCATPKLERATKLLFGVVCTLLLAALTLPYIAPWFY